MTDNIATQEGYTRDVYIYNTCGEGELHCLIKPDTDLDTHFKAWDCDEQEYIKVRGWISEVQDVDLEDIISWKE